jgi:protein gp37
MRGYRDLSPTRPTVFIESELEKPLHWKTPRRIFVESMGDLFADSVLDEWIDATFAVMALCRRHTFILLTKRPDRMWEYLLLRAKSAGRWKQAARAFGYALEFEGLSLVPFPLPNVHLGVSVENQRAADERIPILLDTPAAARWVSVEPMLGPVDLEHSWLKKLNWIVCGAESGPGARACDTEWLNAVYAACAVANVPMFFKQYGSVWARENGHTGVGKSKGQDPSTWPCEWPRELPR